MAQFSQIFKDDTRLGYKIPASEYLTSGKYPIIDQGKHLISGYRNEKNGLYSDIPVIIFGDHTRILKYINTPFFIGADGVKILKPKINDCNYKYLYYVLCNIKIPNTGYNRHFKWIKEVNIDLPELNIQNKVVNTLDRINYLVLFRKQQLSKLDQLVKSRFIEMFGDVYLNTMSWDEKDLESIADIVSGITKGRKVKNKKLKEVPYMAVSNVKDGYIDWSTVKKIDVTDEEISRYRLLKDDVLITEGGDPDKVGRGAIIKNPLENCIHQNHIFRVRLNKLIVLPVFFAEYLQHQKSKRYFLSCAKQTTGIASINMKQLKSLPVLLPPIKLQRQFSDFIQQVEKAKLSVKQSLDKLETLKKSLMQEYFG